MGKSRWRAFVLAGALGLASVVVATAPGHAGGSASRTYRYAALDVYVVGPDLAARAVGDATGVQLAPLGNVEFVPRGNQITVFIDDAANLSGVLDVTVSSGSGATRHCIPVRERTVIGGLRAGAYSSLQIWSAAMGNWSSCRSATGRGATTGTVTIEGL
jgi:hypothetical protein